MLNKQLPKNFETFIQHFVNVIFIILLQLCSDVSQIFYILDIESMIEKKIVISRCKTFTQNVNTCYQTYIAENYWLSFH